MLYCAVDCDYSTINRVAFIAIFSIKVYSSLFG